LEDFSNPSSSSVSKENERVEAPEKAKRKPEAEPASIPEVRRVGSTVKLAEMLDVHRQTIDLWRSKT
jgi:hypothetical protein